MSDEPIFTHQLRDPIKDINGDPATTLSFRMPRVGDIVRCGNPVKYQPVGDDNAITFDEVKAVKMIAALTQIPPPMVERMHPNDFLDCCWGMAPFFLPGMQRTSPT